MIREEVTETVKINLKRSCEGWIRSESMMALFSEGFLWSLFCLWKELYSKIAAAPPREKHRPTREAWRMFLSVLLILHHLPFSCPDSLSSSFWLYLTLCLTRISPALSVSLTASDADAPFDKPVVLEIC